MGKIALKIGSGRYLREKVEKQKMLKMFLFVMCEAPQGFSRIFCPFLAIFALFHWKGWLCLQRPELRNLPEAGFWLLLVNGSLCSVPPSWTPPDIVIVAGESCAYVP